MSWSDGVLGGSSRLLFEAMICRQCEIGVACAFRVPLNQMRSARRQDAGAAHARAGAIYLAVAGFGLSASATGRAFGRHRSSVDHACRRVEERRYMAPGFDWAMACLERALFHRVTAVARESLLWDSDYLPSHEPHRPAPLGFHAGAISHSHLETLLQTTFCGASLGGVQ